MDSLIHIPVLQKEVLKYLDPKPDENFIDCTTGEGNHTFAILEKNGPEGKVLGIEWDPEIFKNTKYRIQNTKYRKRIILVCANFINLSEIVRQYNFRAVQGILFDLGMSSWHLKESKRGFSFLQNEPLDMRYNWKNPLTAEKIVNYWSVQEIEKILKEYGEEKFAKRIAEEIVKTRRIKPIQSTFHLVEIIRKSVPGNYERGRIHPATRTFQALRIAVNDELNNLEKTLTQTLKILRRRGRLVIISFHSLEDRIVKNFLKNQTKEELLQILTKKPIRPSQEEIKVNPRSRSAKLRAAIKI